MNPGAFDSTAASKGVDEQINELDAIRFDAYSTGDYATGFERLRRWKARTEKRLQIEVNITEGNKFQNLNPMFALAPPQAFARTYNTYRGFLVALHQEINAHPESFDSSEEETAPPAPQHTLAGTQSGCVFIVHGHDETNALRLRELLRKWGLEPILLASEVAEGSPTLIEKFLKQAGRASFAIVLLTADDEVHGRTQEGRQGTYSQPRPNVFFELGWFFGVLGREKVWILTRDGTTLATDIVGTHDLRFKDSVIEVAEPLRQELKSARFLP